MKKCMSLLLLALLLTGCAGAETMETVADQPVILEEAPRRQVLVTLPEEAAVPVSESESGKLYLCDGYEIQLQTLAAGNLDATLRTVTGYGQQELSLIRTGINGIKRYDLVWSCLGESGDRVGRAAIYDDGNYHYVLSVLTDADRVRDWEEVFSELFAGYSLGG